MLRNFLIAAIRNMARNRLFTAIIVAGLAAAFAAAIFIALFVYDKFHSESFIPQAQRIYLIGTIIAAKGHPRTAMPYTAPEVAGIMKSAAPDVIETTRRHEVVDTPVRKGELNGNEVVDWVDPNFFAIFRLRSLMGDPLHTLGNPDSVVITRRVAAKYFGTDDVVGKTLELNHSEMVRVTAVLEDLPAGTSLDGQIYASSKASFSPLAQLEAGRARTALDLLPAGTIFTYAMLKDSEDLPLVKHEIALSERIRSRYPEALEISLQLIALNDLHLHMPGEADTSMTMVIGISVVGLLILLMSGINFVNLMTARASARAKEIGIRKVAGADRWHLMLQFFGESALYVAFALSLGIALVVIIEPFLVRFLFQSASLSSYPWLLKEILVGALIFAALAGLYPALVLSALLPQAVLKGGVIKRGGSSLVREILVTTQFAFLIAIVIVTVVMSRQIRFATHDVLHYDSKQILVLDTRCTVSFADEVRKLPGVEALFCSSGAPLTQFSIEPSSAVGDDGAVVTISGLAIDFDFFRFYGMHPVAGRLLAAGFGTDQLHGEDTSVTASGPGKAPTSIVINEKAVLRLGFATPDAALGHVIRRIFPDGSAGRIVGVVPDIVIGPVHEEIRPLFLFADFGQLNRMSVKISRNAIPGTIAAIERLWNQQNRDKPFHPNFLNQLFNWIYHDMILVSQAFAAISVIALFTAAFGLFGLSVYNAQSRTREIGIRKAMGASRLDIALMLSSRFAQPMLLSTLVSWPAAYLAARYWLQGFANHVELTPNDFLVGSAYAFSILGATVFMHAWQTARVDPVGLLRYE